MRLVSFRLSNFRSFLNEQKVDLNSPISIIVGPNGGGKTNLFDTLAVLTRRHLAVGRHVNPTPTAQRPKLRTVGNNQDIYGVVLERHNDAPNESQVATFEIEVTGSDIRAMTEIYASRDKMAEVVNDFDGWNYQFCDDWGDDLPMPGTRIEVSIVDGHLRYDRQDIYANKYMRFLHNYETDRLVHEELGEQRLFFPIIYLPTIRAAAGFTTTVNLPGFNLYDHKRQTEVQYSRQQNGSLQGLSTYRIARFHRLLVDVENGSKQKFQELTIVRDITRYLNILGYEWNVTCTDSMSNQYEIKLKKGGREFRIDQASSGEKELLTYIFIIFGLSIRDAVFLVDEPELHLHPEWQRRLVSIFRDLAAETGNQFVLATHSASLITPESVEHVSRVYSDGTMSRVIRLNQNSLPHDGHLLQIVNVQNNEKIFFSEKVLLVEGLSDQLIFKRLIDEREGLRGKSIEVVVVGGKGMFQPYQTLLNACSIEHFVIADFDYLKQVGSAEVKSLFKADEKKVARDVILNGKSIDGSKLVEIMQKSIEGGQWIGTRDLWDHIVNSRLGVIKDLNEDEAKCVDQCIVNLNKQGIYVLRCGQLEDYLPEGMRSKDVSKLVQFVREGQIVERLKPDRAGEIDTILRSIEATFQ